ncbi:MAG: TlpA family protein disulfide reductase [Nitrospirae bacterium YQR-1]
MIRRIFFNSSAILLIFFLSLILSVSSVFSVPSAPWEIDEIDGKAAPNFELATINGQTISLSSLKGKVVLLNFWATWCPPCKEEMPSMEALSKMFKNKNFTVLAATPNSLSDVQKFTKKNPVGFTLLLDPNNKVSKSFKVYMLPITFLINKEGVIVKKYIGAQNWTEHPIVEDIKKLL